MEIIYKWHVDFVGSNGLVIATSSEEAKEKLFSQFEFDEFSLKNLQIKHLYSIEYATNIISELSNGKVIAFNQNNLKNK